MKIQVNLGHSKVHKWNLAMIPKENFHIKVH
jgi:hypothetical protein